MNFHAIMPFYRQRLTEILIKHFESMNLVFHPVCDRIDIQPFKDNKISWIQPLLVRPLQIPGDQCYRKNDDFIVMADIIDEDYYGFIHDDDMYVPGFIDKIKKQTAKIIFYSASRGQAWATADIGPYNWPPVPLIINTIEDVRIANIDMCQVIVKGEILKQVRYGNSSVCSDGEFAEMLKKTWPNDILILPEFGVNFNYFQPGRYLNQEGQPIFPTVTLK